MESKVVVVTGGSSGIGAAIAVHLCEIGYRKLVIVAR
jgi:NADP-dependent 3-hydroxy acid dehydrogenase YdfG